MTKVYIGIAALIAAFTAGWQINGRLYESAINKSEADRMALTREIEQAQHKKNRALAELAEKELNDILADERVVIKEVVKYAESPNAGKCDLPNKWVREFNRSAGVPKDTAPASRSDDSASGYTDIDALEVTTENNLNHRSCIVRYKRLQDWARGLYE